MKNSLEVRMPQKTIIRSSAWSLPAANDLLDYWVDVALVRRVLAARGALPEEGRRRLERVEAMFAGPPPEIGRDKAA